MFLQESVESLVSTDVYGIRINWISNPSEVYIFSYFNFLMGMIDCFVIFSVSNLIVIQAALSLFPNSKKWKEALKSPIDHLMVSRDDARQEHKRKMIQRSSTGYKGVGKDGKKFKMQISIDGKRKCVNGFDTAIQAALAYDEAAIEKGKKKSTLNFPDGLPINPNESKASALKRWSTIKKRVRGDGVELGNWV